MPINRTKTSVTFNCGCGFIAKCSDVDIKKATALALDHARSSGHTMELHGSIVGDKANRDYGVSEVSYDRTTAH